jgi:RNA polymerase sigma factor (sigma-70 family)
MANAPVTSITLLKGLASGTDNARWAEFFRIYEQPMRSFLQSRFPSVDADDAIQETMVALTRRMPDYHYTPDRNGHFHNYLTGILKHKAEDALRREARESGKRDRLKHGAANPPPSEDWKVAAMNAALEQLLSDESINARAREVFRHVALMHEPPAEVAAAFGISRANVDQIKRRMVQRLSTLVAAMTEDE